MKDKKLTIKIEIKDGEDVVYSESSEAKEPNELVGSLHMAIETIFVKFNI